jgi:rhodanese-related sulfurtransferase
MEKRRAIGMGFVSFVLLSLAFSFSPLVQAAQSPVMSVSPASQQKSQGDTFTIEIVVDPKGEEVYAVQYDLYFDNDLLKATSQAKGTFLSQDGMDTVEVKNEINSSTGKIEYGETRTGESGITNTGVVASISFEVVGASGTSNLKLGDVTLVDTNGTRIESTEINDGTCTVGEVTAGEPAVTNAVTDITVEEAHQMLEEESAKIIVLDVRTEREYNEGYIADAINIPETELESRIGELDNTKKIIVYCPSGGISNTASETLARQGFEKVYNMLGGMDEWKIHFTVIKQEPTNVAAPSSTLSPSLSTSPAVSPRFSPTPTSTVSSTTTPPSKTTPIPTTGGFEAIAAITGILAISYLFIRKRK